MFEDRSNNRGCFPFSEDFLPALAFFFHMNEPARPAAAIDWGDDSDDDDEYDDDYSEDDFDTIDEDELLDESDWFDED